MVHNVTFYFSCEMIEIRASGKRRLYTGSPSDSEQTSQRTRSEMKLKNFNIERFSSYFVHFRVT